jgi:hypothetical protein
LFDLHSYPVVGVIETSKPVRRRLRQPALADETERDVTVRKGSVDRFVEGQAGLERVDVPEDALAAEALGKVVVQPSCIRRSVPRDGSSGRCEARLFPPCAPIPEGASAPSLPMSCARSTWLCCPTRRKRANSRTPRPWPGQHRHLASSAAVAASLGALAPNEGINASRRVGVNLKASRRLVGEGCVYSSERAKLRSSPPVETDARRFRIACALIASAPLRRTRRAARRLLLARET